MNVLLYVPVFFMAVGLVYFNFTYSDESKTQDVSLDMDGDLGEPLILTPYLDKGLFTKARELSRVSEAPFLGIKSFSGFFTVDQKHNSNLFFWFIPATEIDYKTAPLILWLQGGPGAASTFSTFTENGPFEIVNKKTIKLSKYSWTANHSVLYIDSPVGTGFSFTNSKWCTNQEEIGNHLYITLVQFFQLFPELRSNDFFIAGVSYAGKMIPAVGHIIHQKNQESETKINLKGIAIGNGFSDMINQVDYGEYLYQNGLIDLHGKAIMDEMRDAIIANIKLKNYMKAFEIFDDQINGGRTKYPTAFKNLTGFDNYFNLLHPKGARPYKYFMEFLQGSSIIRKCLHVGNLTASTDAEVESSLLEDLAISVAPWVSELLSHYRVLIYTGHLDIMVGYRLTEKYLEKLEFSSSDEYKTAKRYIWTVNGDITGYSKVAGNLTDLMVRNAGHSVVRDQPVWALDMISKFVRNKPLH